jgi:hypothetical protein
MGITKSLALAVVLAAAVAIGGVAQADSGNSDPAHVCLNALQWDYYTVISGDPEAVDFAGLTHGFDEAANSAYVQTSSHNECVSFFARNKSDGNPGKSNTDIEITKAVDKSSP